MNLTTKFSLILFSTFSVSLAIGGLYSYQLTEDNARQQVTDQAELILQEALAIRDYTVNEIRPLLKNKNDGLFHPQTVPAYSATQIANVVRQSRPQYRYKEAVMNPTNPRDKANPLETDIINRFIQDPTLKKQVGDMLVDTHKLFYIAYPIKITNPKCLTCHSTPEAAPQAMRTIYGDKGGFGWKLNEIVGTQIVAVPYKLSAQLAKTTFFSFMGALAMLFLVLFVTLNIMIRKLVLTPITTMAKMADELSKGNLTGDELKISGNDEIANLSRSFNRVRRSVIKILQVLPKTQR